MSEYNDLGRVLVKHELLYQVYYGSILRPLL